MLIFPIWGCATRKRVCLTYIASNQANPVKVILLFSVIHFWHDGANSTNDRLFANLHFLHGTPFSISILSIAVTDCTDTDIVCGILFQPEEYCASRIRSRVLPPFGKGAVSRNLNLVKISTLRFFPGNLHCPPRDIFCLDAAYPARINGGRTTSCRICRSPRICRCRGYRRSPTWRCRLGWAYCTGRLRRV